MIPTSRAGKTRFLVLHDYGMGGIWWWIWADSVQDIVTTIADVEVVADPQTIGRVAKWSLDEVDLLAAPDHLVLGDMCRRRTEQRGQVGFGALVGRDAVYLRQQEAGDDIVYLMELGTDGRRLRQVAVLPDGVRYRSAAADWPFNPPFDLYDPQYLPMEIDATDFDEAWNAAEPDPDWCD